MLNWSTCFIKSAPKMHKLFHDQPAVLKTFFATEMWERYGFYVVQSLLALYLALHFHWSDESVYTLVSAFTALTYLSPVMGGWVADHWLGQKKSIIVATFFLFIGYVALACMQSDAYLKLALTAVAVGTGLLKPNISSLLGHSYDKYPGARESGFTIFYMGITLGIVLGTTLPSYLQRTLGWSTTFASAAIGIFVALNVFCFGIKHYQIKDFHENRVCPKRAYYQAMAAILGLWFVCFLVLNDTHLGALVFSLVLALSVGFILRSARKESPHQARQTHVIGMLCFISVLYWAFYFQMFLSLTLFIVRLVKPTLFGFSFPAPYYVCVESIGMLIFGYFLSRKQSRASLKEIAIRASTKFASAVFAMTLAYAWIVAVSGLTPVNMLISPLLLIPPYLLISISELLLSPIGLSVVSMLANRKHVSTLTGVFFVSLSLGAYLAGALAKFTTIDPKWSSQAMIQAHYFHGFSILFLMLMVASFICFSLHRKIVGLMHSHGNS